MDIASNLACLDFGLNRTTSDVQAFSNPYPYQFSGFLE